MALKPNVIHEAERVLDIEANAILALKGRLQAVDFEKAIHLILKCQGKVIATGIGKSGIVARKIASTLSSTGTPSTFLHPAESSHGDMGLISENDVVLAISSSGETKELGAIVDYVARKNVPLIAMTGGLTSSLAMAAQALLDVGVDREACPLNLAPTASSTAALAMGDALAMAILNERGFKPEDFAELHPGGRLGFKLLTRVSDVMHKGEALPIVNNETSMREVLFKMSRRDVLRGVAGVVDRQGSLVGVVTDGDIRRRLEKSQNPLDDSAADLMSVNPKTIDANELAEKALFLMEQFMIQVLFVVDRNSAQPKRPIGAIHLQDLVRAKVR